LCFSPEGKYLATGLFDGGISVSLSFPLTSYTHLLQIWEIKTKYVRNAFKRHTDCIRSLDFSPNGRLLVAASQDNTVQLWDMRYGAAKSLAEDFPTFIDRPYYWSAVFSPNGRYVAASHRDGIVRIWDVRTGQLIRRLKADIDAVFGIAFMPDGKGLVSGGMEGILRYWDISSLYTTRASQMANDLHGHVPGMEDHPQPEREFIGHTVRLSISSLLLFMQLSSSEYCPLPCHLA